MRVQRLTRRADFERVRTQGQTHGTRLFLMILARGAGRSARIGVAAGKRIGGAVQRNRAKRLLREGIRPVYPSIAPGWDIVLMARSPILDAKSLQVSEALQQTLRRLGVLAESEA